MEKKKGTTIDELAELMKSEFERSDKRMDDKFKNSERQTDKKIDDLAGMVQWGFTDMKKKLGGRIDGLEGEIGGMKKSIKNLNVGVASIEYNQNEMMKKMDGLAYKYEIDELRIKLEKRILALEVKTKATSA